MAKTKKFNPSAAAERILNISSLENENETIEEKVNENKIDNNDVIDNNEDKTIENNRVKSENISKKNMTDEYGNPVIQKSYYITKNQYMAINVAAAKRGVKPSVIVREAINEFLKNEMLHLKNYNVKML